MITLTKEWLLKTIAELEEERDATPGAVNEDASMALAAMKIALASLEAEPVAFRSKLQPPSAIGSERWDYTDHRQPDAFELENCVIERLYTAPPAQEVPEVYNIGDATMRHIFTPAVITDVSDMQAVFDQIETVLAGMWQPAPVSVPDELTREEYKRRFMEDDSFDDTFRGGWNACRAAMLHGAEPVSNRDELTDGWVACSKRMPSPSTGVIVAAPWQSAPGGYAMKWATNCPGHPDADIDGWIIPGASWSPTHWMPLPAAPQQEDIIC
ncbi:DUF551 domain-containing protein [Escherichia coli]|uniref:DUF551 domain-containing protein n=2 Tax=Escherichia coli TaxID=562 RepID=UPI001CD3C14B|nr:DUF551 domain-containing protein [Escherichia coli]